MKKNLFPLAAFLLLAFFVISCGEKGPQPVPIENLETYEDATTKFSVQYPSNWVTRETPGKRFLVVSDDLATKRFFSYDPTGFPGAMIDVVVLDMDTSRTLDTIITLSQRFAPEVYQMESVTIDGVDAKKFTYSFPLSGGTFMGEMYIAAKDTNKATVLKLEAFDGTFDQYREDFKKIVSTFVLAVTPAPVQIDTTFVEEEALPPSTTLVSRSGTGYTIDIPDNFHMENDPLKTSSTEKSYFYIGDRRGDSFIRVEIIDSEKQSDLSKIVEDNKSTFAGASAPRQTNLGGAKAYVIDYKPSGQVKGRVWLALHNKKLYRVFLNWYAPEEADFLPPFEKSASSFKFI